MTFVTNAYLKMIIIIVIMLIVDQDSIRLWLGVRTGLLSIIEVIEIVCKISPKTSELRKMIKHN